MVKQPRRAKHDIPLLHRRPRPTPPSSAPLQTPHCLSTRVVLNHYGQCQDAKCAMCEPLRAVGSKVRERDGKSV